MKTRPQTAAVEEAVNLAQVGRTPTHGTQTHTHTRTHTCVRTYIRTYTEKRQATVEEAAHISGKLQVTRKRSERGKGVAAVEQLIMSTQ